jgi:transketolase
MNPSRKIAMELKNRTNTDNASSRKANLDKLAAFKKKNPEYTGIYATLNDSTEQKTRDGSVKKFIHDGVELEQYVGYEVLTLVLGEDRDKVLECVRDTLYELD